MVNTYLSWTACVLLLIGLKLVGDKKSAGLFVAAASEALWVAWGVMTHSMAIVAMGICLICMYVRAIQKWMSAV